MIARFLHAADERGPVSSFAGRVLAPLLLGAIIGVLPALLLGGRALAWVVIVLSVAGLVWALWQLRAIRVDARRVEADQARLEHELAELEERS